MVINGIPAILKARGTNPALLSHDFKSGDGATSTKEILLDESDQLYMQIRHTHIAECITTLISSFNQFVTENKAAASASKKGQVANLKEMKEMMSAMPQFQELKAKASEQGMLIYGGRVMLKDKI